MMILGNTGFPVYFQKAPGGFVLDFKKQPATGRFVSSGQA